MRLNIQDTIIDIPVDLAAPVINAEIKRVENMRKFEKMIENRRKFIMRKRRLRIF